MNTPTAQRIHLETGPVFRVVQCVTWAPGPRGTQWTGYVMYRTRKIAVAGEGGAPWPAWRPQ